MNPIRILLLSSGDDLLPPVERHLRDDGLEPLLQRVGDLRSFAAALDASEWDAVLCDDPRGDFGGVSIPAYLRGRSRRIPCIVLADAPDVECIVRAMKAGAHDYVVKENLSRLTCAVRSGSDEGGSGESAEERAKNDFLSTLSHELRTPMTVFMGMVELALGTELSPDQRYYLTTAMSSAETLLRIIEDLLDFAQMERGHTAFASAPFDLRRCIEGALEKVAPSAKRKGLSVTLCMDDDLPEAFVGDEERLRQALDNLLCNAVKFTDRGRIAVSAVIHPDRSALRISVRDTGIGIPEDKQGVIFQSFTQLDGTNIRRFGGMGLGLALTRRIAEGMGGSLEVSSRVGSGSEFRLVLPLRDERRESCAEERKVTYRTARCRTA